MSTPASIAQPTSRVNEGAVLAVVAVAQFMVILDATIVNVALPTIKTDVGFSEQSLSWVLNAYTLMFGGFLLLGGRAADRLGRRRLVMAGVALFAGAALVCGVAQSEAVLVVGRVARLRCVAIGGDAAYRARRAAPRRRDGLARGALDHPHNVRGGKRAQPGPGRLGSDRRRRRRRRPPARRRDRPAAQLALGLLRECADRRGGTAARAADRPREPGRRRPRRLRRRGRGGDHAGHDG